MGDPYKVLLLGVVLDVIKEQQLLERVRASGQALMDGLLEIQERYPGVVTAARGLGTMCAFDCPYGMNQRELLNLKLLEQGVIVGTCGESSIRLRPALIFEPKHAEIFLDRLERAIKTM